ncbi:MAG: hypothetical protein Q9198_008805 [Flavoplaca austrocitrina]
MKVEARDAKVDKGKQKAEDIQDVEEEQRVPQTGFQDATSTVGVSSVSNDAAKQEEHTELAHDRTSVAPLASQPPASVLVTSSAPTISYRPHNRGTSTDTSPIHQHRFQHFQQTPRRQADSPVTIDRAIAGVFLALFIMILKKVFYPSSSGGVFGGYDDLRMMRE